MLELYFRYPKVLRRLRDGALGEEIDRIAAHFSAAGYKHASAKLYISRLGAFSDYIAHNTRMKRIDESVIDRFLQRTSIGKKVTAREIISG
jgi:hypothetical protein